MVILYGSKRKDRGEQEREREEAFVDAVERQKAMLPNREACCLMMTTPRGRRGLVSRVALQSRPFSARLARVLCAVHGQLSRP